MGSRVLKSRSSFLRRPSMSLNSIIAYNNLGINLMLIGEWARAEEIIKRALDLAIDTNHVHVAGILDSSGRAKNPPRRSRRMQKIISSRPLRSPVERKREWYAAQAMRNLARCYLAQGQIEKADRESSGDDRAMRRRSATNIMRTWPGSCWPRAIFAKVMHGRCENCAAGDRRERSDVRLLRPRKHSKNPRTRSAR